MYDIRPHKIKPSDDYSPEALEYLRSIAREKVNSDERVLLGHSPFEQYNSSPREMMKYVQLGQSLEVLKPDSRLLYTGVDMQYGKYAFTIKAPTAMLVKGVYPLYDKATGGFSYNPTILVYYQDLDSTTGSKVVMGVLELTALHLMDKSYGFEYVPTDEFYRMMEIGNTIEKDAVLYKSSTVVDDMDYRFGVQGNTVAISHSRNIQDGITVSESFSKRASFKEYGKRSQSFGRKLVPLNLFGDPNDPEDYKIFPDLGEYSRPDGLLMAFREYDEMTAPVDMTDERLRTLLPTDFCVYGSKDIRCRVIDVTVHYNEGNRTSVLEDSMRKQPDKYISAIRNTYSTIYRRFCDDRRKEGNVEINRQSQEAMMWIYGNRTSVERVDNQRGQPTVMKSYKGEALDEIEIELTYEAYQELSLGKKMSNFGGGKGVVTCRLPDAMMPKDQFGNVADVVISGDTYIKRMIGSALMEIIITAIDQQMVRLLKRMINEGKEHAKVVDHYVKHLEIISPSYLGDLTLAVEDKEHPFDLYKDHILPLVKSDAPNKFVHRCRLPITNPVYYPAAIPLAAKHNEYEIGNIVVTNDYGDEQLTAWPIPIGSVYYTILEKTGYEWTATDTAKRTPLNTPAKLGHKDKNASTVRNSAGKVMSETEYRWWLGILGGDVTDDWMNISLSPESSRSYHYDWQSALGYGLPPERLVKSKRGMSRPSKLVLQVLECQGIGFGRKGKRV